MNFRRQARLAPLALAVYFTLAACSSVPGNAKYESAALYSVPEPGLYSALECDERFAAGMLESRGPGNGIALIPFCIDPDLHSDSQRLGYVHVNADSVSRFCYSLIGYAEETDEGISEVGRRVSDCFDVEK